MRASLTRLGAVAHKELLHVRRDPRTLIFALVVPIALILLFGFAISFDIDQLPIAVVDQDRSAESERFVRRLTATEELVVHHHVDSVEEAYDHMRRGDVLAILVVPARFASTPVPERRVQLLIDGSDGSTANALLGKGQALGASAMISLIDGPLPEGGGAELALLGVFNPAGLSAWFIVPGLAAYVVAIIAVLLTALTIAREIEQGSMAQLLATPVGRAEIILGKLLPYLALGALAVTLVLAVGFLVFDLPLRGSVPTLVVASLLFLLGMLGQGLLISTVTGSQMVATQVATMSSMLPSMLLSGFIFPIENMPLPLQWITHVIPARYYVDVLRGILLRGNGFDVLWPELLALGVFAVAILGLATARFSREAA
ncbi:MAG: ABC transporter permease [Deltaproteobacteria bacterium]|nr:ABC transporter permease [Deltaproteobacteria bacterium]